MMTHKCHWNVTGPMFNTLHTMFMDQYTEQWNSLDAIAERIRSLGFYAPGMAELSALTQINDNITDPSDWRFMVQSILKATEKVCVNIRDAIDVADDADDESTEDFLTGRLSVYEKNAWMLRSLIS